MYPLRDIQIAEMLEARALDLNAEHSLPNVI